MPLEKLKFFYATDGEVCEIPFKPGFAYPKEDADKVIDELTAENKRLKMKNEDMRLAINNMFDKLLKMREHYLGGYQKRSSLAKKSSQ